VYTDWCGWCKVMDKKTFTDEGIKKYLDENFYVVKFNAEQKEPIMFNGKEYVWRSGGRRGVNTLAVEMLNGRLGYPSLVFLDSNLEKIKVVPGYKTPDQLMDVIKDVKAVL
ncbi:MAG: thioredoxin fold domain-containing protein, partial [Bacteroidia bacterium]|nr:thioredoxin fold domain-containing protein [Bacteroidia bacterium]